MSRPRPFPAMCSYHLSIFKRLDKDRKLRVRHPDQGRTNLVKRATDHAKACPQCPTPT